MITPSKFAQLQKLFFNKVTKCCNPSSVTFSFIKLTSEGGFADFTGDSSRSIDKEVSLRCFYDRNLSDKSREKYGVSSEVTTIVFISPLELKQKYGDIKFPDYVRTSFSQISVTFLGKHYEIENIIDLEPMHNGKEWMCLAYQVNLMNSTGNTDID